MESPEINPYESDQLTYAKGGKTTCNGVKKVYSINGVGKIGQIRVKMKLHHLLISYTRTNSKWIKDVTVKTQNNKTPRRKHRQ